jgi:hypothetical protein
MILAQYLRVGFEIMALFKYNKCITSESGASSMLLRRIYTHKYYKDCRICHRAREISARLDLVSRPTLPASRTVKSPTRAIRQCWG